MNAKRGPKLLLEVAKKQVLQGVSETRLQKKAVHRPREGCKAWEYCESVLSGYGFEEAGKIAKLEGTSEEQYRVRYRPYLYAEILARTADFRADGILRATQKIKEKEKLTDEHDYYDWMKLRHDMTKDVGGGNGDNTSKFTLVIEGDKPEDKKVIDADTVQTTPTPEKDSGK